MKKILLIGAVMTVLLSGAAQSSTMSREQIQGFLKNLDSQLSACEKQKDLVDSKECDFGNNTRLLFQVADIMSPANKAVMNSCEDCQKSVASIGLRLMSITDRMEVDIQKNKAKFEKNRRPVMTHIRGMDLYVSNFTFTAANKARRGFDIKCSLKSGTGLLIDVLDKRIHEYVDANETITVGSRDPIHIGFHLDMDQVRQVDCYGL